MSEGGETASDLVAKEKGRVENLAFKIFAVVGFVSSIVTLIGWFNSSSAALTMTVNEKTIELPKSLELKRQDSASVDIGTATDDMAQKYCNPVSVDYNGSKSRNFFYNQKTCDTQSSLLSTIKQIASMQGKPLIAYDILLKNDGSSVADNIKIKSPIDVDASGYDNDGSAVRINALQPRRLFSIPSLNPRESTKVRLVSTTPVKESFEDDDTAPSVTFSGGKASTKRTAYLSGRYADAIEFLDGLSLFFQIIVVVVGALMITLIWLVPVSLLASAADNRKAKSDAPVL